MWVWNVTRDLIRAVGLTPLPVTVAADAQPAGEIAWALSGRLADDEVACVKVHRFVDPRASDCLIIGPWRDLFESSLSFMRFKAMPFRQYLASLNGGGGARISRFLATYPDGEWPNLLAIPYPDILADSASVIRRIAGFIGADVHEADIARITGAWSRAQVESLLVRDAGAAPVPGEPHRTYDPVTGFSSNHFTPDEPLVLSDEQEAQLRNVIRGIMARGELQAKGKEAR